MNMATYAAILEEGSKVWKKYFETNSPILSVESAANSLFHINSFPFTLPVTKEDNFLLLM